MSRKKKIIIYLCAGLIAALICAALRGVFSCTDKSRLYTLLCDSAFFSGIMLCGLGAVIWTAQKGIFDGLGFLVSSTRARFSSSEKQGKNEKYQEYVARQREKQDADIVPFFAAGGIWLAVSVILLIVYMQI